MSSIVEAMARRNLADMAPEGLRQWLVKRRTLLAHHKRFVQRYLDRRQRQRGNRKPTHTDRQYIQFQKLAADLLELLGGVIYNVERYMQDATSEKEHSDGAVCLCEGSRLSLPVGGQTDPGGTTRACFPRGSTPMNTNSSIE